MKTFPRLAAGVTAALTGVALTMAGIAGGGGSGICWYSVRPGNCR